MSASWGELRERTRRQELLEARQARAGNGREWGHPSAAEHHPAAVHDAQRSARGGGHARENLSAKR